MKPFIVVTDKKINGLKRFSTIFCIYISLIGLAENLPTPRPSKIKWSVPKG